jgi:hypothetical protein
MYYLMKLSGRGFGLQFVTCVLHQLIIDQKSLSHPGASLIPLLFFSQNSLSIFLHRAYHTPYQRRINVALIIIIIIIISVLQWYTCYRFSVATVAGLLLHQMLNSPSS